jgi:hypothetical protein
LFFCFVLVYVFDSIVVLFSHRPIICIDRHYE